MNTSGSTPGISRVVVAVGATVPGRSAVKTGVDLAAALGAALEGLFVESAELLRACALPTARETSALTGVRRPLATDDLERAFRVEAARLERLLAAQAARTRIEWSFTVSRGQLWETAVARDAELIVLEPRMSMSALRESHRTRGRLLTVFDATPPARRGLAAATRLARALGSELVILVPDGTGASDRSARGEAESWLGAEQVAGIALPVPAERGSVMAAARAHRGILLVLPLQVAAHWSPDISALAADAPCPLVIAR